jgi:Gpi18-like mannosyltransferase
VQKILRAIKNFLGDKDYTFPLTMWLLSRLVIVLLMVVIVPVFSPVIGWKVFANWDGELYHSIITRGYIYNPAQKEYLVAFFPLFPLLIKAVMKLGFSFELAGILVNNLAFLGAILLVYNWVKELYGIQVARWTSAILAWCPFSLFGTVIYTEGLYLLLTSFALRAFQKSQYTLAALGGALATATRPPGIAITLTFLLASWREKRPLAAYISGISTTLGILLYSLYCWLKFADPLIFLKAQKAWQPEQNFWGQSWLKMLVQATAGYQNWRHGSLVDPWYPLAFILICLGGYWLGKSQLKLGKNKTQFGLCFLAIVLWLLGGSPLINTVTILGSIYLLWRFRSQLNLLAIYGFCSFGIIFSSGRSTSAERYTYGIISVSIALGLLLQKYPRWGYPVVGFFGILLASLAVRFSQHQWAG